MKMVKDFDISKKMGVDELVRQMYDAGGFTAKHLAQASDILEIMENDKCLRFLSFPAAITATGTRGIIREFLEKKLFDVVITTCGTLDHDIARSLKKYYHGSFAMDDTELRKKNINRLGNVLVPDDSYGIPIEKFMQNLLKGIKSGIAPHELCWEIGKNLKEDSILYWCWKHKIPVIIPGITDGAVGYQIWQYSEEHDITIDVLKDEKLLNNKVWDAKKSGALIIGGGISKHHVIWWNQFKNGLDYAVYISTAPEFDGSLSGARPREAVSWGKINEKAQSVLVEADATITLPILWASLKERLKI